MIIKSIRFKITLLYMAILAITLTSFSAVLYHNVNHGLRANMDTLLKSKAGGIVQAIDAYWEASNLEAIESGVKSEALNKRRNINFAKVAQKWVKEESTDPKLLDIIVRVFDTDGKTISSSKNTQGLTDMSKENFLSVLQGRNRFDTIGLFRIYTTPVFENEKVAYIAQVASPFTSIETALTNLKFALIALFPITVFLTGMLGVLLAKAALHPVDNMVDTIHQITAENMKLKLKVPETKDEIRKLAETFNNMLGRLERAFTSQRQLFADLSHELKTPLTILKGEFEVVLKKIRSQAEYEGTLKSALEEINRIAKLAENILLLAKMDSREVLPEKNALDLNGLLRYVVNNIKGLTELKMIRLSLDVKDEIPLNGDESQLKTLFINVLDNAIKYTMPEGNIRVTSKKEKAFAEVKIEDTGIGISGEEVGNIFDRFYRIDKSRNSSGFGLGLSIAKSIAEAHEGTIKVESALGRGTVFTIILPLKE